LSGDPTASSPNQNRPTAFSAPIYPQKITRYRKQNALRRPVLEKTRAAGARGKRLGGRLPLVLVSAVMGLAGASTSYRAACPERRRTQRTRPPVLYMICLSSDTSKRTIRNRLAIDADFD